MTELFRKVPSKELVEEILIHLQFLGFNDNRIFTKFDISKERFEAVPLSRRGRCKLEQINVVLQKLISHNKLNKSAISFYHHISSETDGYYFCLDDKVITSHSEEIYNLISNTSIKLFLMHCERGCKILCENT